VRIDLVSGQGDLHLPRHRWSRRGGEAAGHVTSTGTVTSTIASNSLPARSNGSLAPPTF